MLALVGQNLLSHGPISKIVLNIGHRVKLHVSCEAAGSQSGESQRHKALKRKVDNVEAYDSGRVVERPVDVYQGICVDL